ncbi:hypothetical protein HNQ59_003301 [Chitinivorax tropicus]|uniref:PepSY domain-containing protein n=1 Tax=Chitinivorax tropicus TaxID=714531 RepID=A0A840MUJ2_9PROT|nr:PepSY domain-containing protein [Chitinivorax tropicus]MBB5019993.1 hypothetical protein [Chitinivorax tropicus]
MTHSDSKLTRQLTASRWLGRCYRWHKQIALVVAIPAVLWALTGLAHPIMTRLFPSALTMQPPTETIQTPEGQPLASIMRQAGIHQIEAAWLIAPAGRPTWQIRQPGPDPYRYFDAVTGQENPDGDRQRAIQLARHFAGDQHSPLRNAQRLTQFDADYPSVNRLLPVWRVDFDRPDRLRAYVETGPARLSALVDDRKAIFQQLFRILHNWSWADDWPGPRRLVMTILLIGIATTTAIGLLVYILQKSRPSRPASRVWHRRIGLLATLSMLAFCSSAVLHLWLKAPLAPPVQLATPFDTTLLTAQPTQLKSGAVLVNISGQAAWLLPRMSKAGGAEHQHHAAHTVRHPTPPARYLDAATGQVLPDGEPRHVQHLTTRLLGQPATGNPRYQWVHRFEGEYGFINKRLPVVQIKQGDRTDYLELSTASWAAHIEPSVRTEGYLFSWLHKAQWLDPLGKNTRDTVLGCFALLNAIMIGIGVWMWWKKRRSPRGSPQQSHHSAQ